MLVVSHPNCFDGVAVATSASNAVGYWFDLDRVNRVPPVT